MHQIVNTPNSQHKKGKEPQCFSYKHWFYQIGMGLLIVLFVGSNGYGDIIQLGEFGSDSDGYYYGKTSTGSLEINGGSTTTNVVKMYLGKEEYGIGSVTINELNSAWYNTDNLYIGYAGIGNIQIEDAGKVVNTNGVIAWDLNSKGSVVVNGNGSNWENDHSLFVGWNGRGEVSVENTGQMSSDYGYIGSNLGAEGSVTVNGSDGSGNKSMWINQHDLYIGYYGTGNLTIETGGSVENDRGYIGRYEDSEGSVIVNGVGSTWTNHDIFTVGRKGSGYLRIENGGSVSNTIGYIGLSSTGQGAVSVSGAELGNPSTWQNNDNLYIGGNDTILGGIGLLTIDSGGLVKVANTTQIWDESVLIVEDDIASIGGSNALESGFDTDNLILSGGIFEARNITGNNTNFTFTSGRLGITGPDGVTVNTGEFFETLEIESNREVNVSNNLTIQGNGSVSVMGGILEIGGTLTDIGSLNLTNGTLYMNGGDWDKGSDLIIGANSGETFNLEIGNGGNVSNDFGSVGWDLNSEGTVSVIGTGSSWTNTFNVSVGNLGKGELNIEEGGSVSDAIGYIGYGLNSEGIVTVSGNGSTWHNNSSVIVGVSGIGHLFIADGGNANSLVGVIGNGDKAAGIVSVDGTGSSWNNTHWLSIGEQGYGELYINDGGYVSNNNQAYIGNLSTAEGRVTVSGTGSIWMNHSELNIGEHGIGELNIDSGGYVESVVGYIGDHLGSKGTVTVSGKDTFGNSSIWRNNDVLHIGLNGTGNLTIETDGLVEVENKTSVFSTGALTINNNGRLHTDVLSLYNGVVSGTQTLSIGSNTTNDSYIKTQIEGENGEIWNDILLTDVESTIEIKGESTSNMISLRGDLSGNGDITNIMLFGLISPGESIGSINISNTIFEAGSSTVIELESDTRYDQLIMNSDIILDGILEVALLDIYMPNIGDVFTIFDLTENPILNGEFLTLSLPALNSGFWGVSELYTSGNLIVLSEDPIVPEPTTFAMLLIGGSVLLGVILRRKK